MPCIYSLLDLLTRSNFPLGWCHFIIFYSFGLTSLLGYFHICSMVLLLLEFSSCLRKVIQDGKHLSQLPNINMSMRWSGVKLLGMGFMT
jgi:hypothetical protein